MLHEQVVAEIAAANACASKALILPACAPNTPKMSVLFPTAKF